MAETRVARALAELAGIEDELAEHGRKINAIAVIYSIRQDDQPLPDVLGLALTLSRTKMLHIKVMIDDLGERVVATRQHHHQVPALKLMHKAIEMLTLAVEQCRQITRLIESVREDGDDGTG